FRRNPPLLTLLVMGYWLALALVNSVPLLGGVVSYLAMPALSLVLMNACRALDRGLAITPQSLTSGIKPQAPVLVALGGLYLCATLLILGLTSLVDGGDLFRLMIVGGPHAEAAMDSPEFLLATQLALVLVLPLVMAFWFAPMLAAWHRLSTGKALFFSFFACLRNWRPFLTYSLSVLLWSGLLPALAMGLLGLVLGGGLAAALVMVPLVLMLAPTLVASFYVSYREIFIAGEAGFEATVGDESDGGDA
ncbi:MAG TPA: BPSS1780 family membrane protein, partial [Azospira sp.]|nr:BPSS1780 family membrane protein [Azospira sp.]